MAVQTTCKFCSYQWPCKGNKARATCPCCKRKNRVNSILASEGPRPQVQVLHSNQVQQEKKDDELKNNPPQVPTSPKLPQVSNEVAPDAQSELSKPEHPVESQQPLTNEQIDKIIMELAERIRKSKEK